uniref:P53 and DNA damage-regulated protein 1 n=1 Tax=Caenorhabditis tropicalis TaxID=1561998 RepID=A0A1I7UYT1_9PELO
MITNLTTGMAMNKTKTPHDHEKEVRDRTTEIIYLSTKLNHAKETCVNLDKERQRLREVGRRIREKDIDPVWIYNGTCFLQTSQSSSLNILEKDMKTVEEVREQVGNVIKQDTDTFLRLHKQRNLVDRGFDLKPVLKNGKITD